jgi:hypothetical protein
MFDRFFVRYDKGDLIGQIFAIWGTVSVGFYGWGIFLSKNSTNYVSWVTVWKVFYQNHLNTVIHILPKFVGHLVQCGYHLASNFTIHSDHWLCMQYLRLMQHVLFGKLFF